MVQQNRILPHSDCFPIRSWILNACVAMISRILGGQIVKHPFGTPGFVQEDFNTQGELEGFHRLLRLCSTQSRQVPRSKRKIKWANEVWALLTFWVDTGFVSSLNMEALLLRLPQRFPWPTAIAKRILQAFSLCGLEYITIHHLSLPFPPSRKGRPVAFVHTGRWKTCRKPFLRLSKVN